MKSISSLKVAELKDELQKRDVAFSSKDKKGDLIQVSFFLDCNVTWFVMSNVIREHETYTEKPVGWIIKVVILNWKNLRVLKGFYDNLF